MALPPNVTKLSFSFKRESWNKATCPPAQTTKFYNINAEHCGVSVSEVAMHR